MNIGKSEYEKYLTSSISQLSGNCLLLLPKENLPSRLPPSINEISEWPNIETNSTFHSILSIGNLASETDLPQFLTELQQYADQQTRLYFCERTKTPDGYSGSAKYDITGTLWEAGWSVIHCERFKIGKSKRSPSYVYGIARRKRSK